MKRWLLAICSLFIFSAGTYAQLLSEDFEGVFQLTGKSQPWLLTVAGIPERLLILEVLTGPLMIMALRLLQRMMTIATATRVWII
jgi:hypothetical protein